MRGPGRRRTHGRASSSARSPRPPSISRSISSPSRPTRRSRRCMRRASSRCPTRTLARALYDTTQEVCAARGLPGLRDFQSCAAGRGVPAQSRLLARARIRRHRPRRAWPSRRRRRAPRHRDRAAAGDLADAGRSRSATASPQRRGAPALGDGRRVPADGTAARRRHRPRALSAARRAARSIRAASRSCCRKARSRPRPTENCA